MSFSSVLFGGGETGVPAGPTAAQTTGANSGLAGSGAAGANFMNSYGAQGQQGLNSGLNNLSPVANWFQTILNGNKQATLNQLQPQIQQVQGGLNTGLQTANQLNARGGGRSSTLFGLPFEAQKEISGQYAGARAGAAPGLQGAATAQGALGSAAAGAGAQFGQVGNQANNQLLNYGLSRQQQAYTQSQQNGGLFGKLISPLLGMIPGVGPFLSAGAGALGGLFKGKGGLSDAARLGTDEAG